MNFSLYAFVAWRSVTLAILPAVFAGMLGLVYASHQTHAYQANATLYIEITSGPGSGNAGAPDVYSSEAVIPTYTRMLELPNVAEEVNRIVSVRYPGYDIGGHALTVGAGSATDASQSTQLLNVALSDLNAGRAAYAVNTLTKVFIRKVQEIQRSRFAGSAKDLQLQLATADANIQSAAEKIQKYHGTEAGLSTLKAARSAYTMEYQSLITAQQEFQQNKDAALHSVRVLSPAVVPGAPAGSQPYKFAIEWAVVALLLSVAGIVALDVIDDTPRDPSEVEVIMGAPVLGTIIRFKRPKNSGPLTSGKSSATALSEAYRLIRTNVQFSDPKSPPRSIVVTSAFPGEGKSTTVSNLASVMAEAGRQVTVIDADLRRPTLHGVFKRPRRQGLTNILQAEAAIDYDEWILSTDRPNLSLIPSGSIPAHPADLVGSNEMKQLLDHLRTEDRTVFIDSPPVLAVTDAAILSTLVDAVIIVVDLDKTKRRDLVRVRESIEGVGGTVLGVVINNLSRHGSRYYYYNYRYSYGYGYRYSGAA